jgi:putative ABC transport system permease protein
VTLPIQYSLRSLWVRRTTTFATAAGVALVVFVLASSMMLAQGLRETLLRAGSPNKIIVLDVNGYSEGGSRMRQNALGLVSATPGVRRGANDQPDTVGESVVHVFLSIAGDANAQASIQVRGVTADSFRLRPNVHIVEGRLPKAGTDEAMIGTALLSGKYTGAALDQGFELKKNRRLHIVGVFAAEGSAYESEVWADLETVRSSFAREGYLSSVTAELESPIAFDQVKNALTGNKQLGLSVERETEYYEKVSNGLARGISGLGAVVATIFSFGAALGAMITLYGSVSQRRRELGVLRALGFTRLHILGAVLLEASALALCGGALGIALSLLTPLLNFSTVNWATGQQLAFRFAPSVKVLADAFLAGTAVGLLGGVFPALQAASVDPAKAMRA